MSAQVVGIHGVWNRQARKSPQEAATILGRRWSGWLREGFGVPEVPEVTMAYYAHLLAKEVAQGADDPEFLQPREREILLAWAEALGAPAEVAQGRLTMPARAAVSWIVRHRNLDSGLGRRLIMRFCREVHTYFDDADRRAEVREEAARVIRAAADPVVVIGHSLGSVVAYETLWEMRDARVELLLTLGSPLALPNVIFHRLAPSAVDGMGRKPPCVRRWVNISDPGDIVAVPKGLANFFTGVDADVTNAIGAFDMHRARGYLTCGATSAAVAAVPWAQRPPSEA